jgi:hypothetical protein
LNTLLLIYLSVFSTNLSISERLSLSYEYDSNVYRSTLNSEEGIYSDFDLKLQSDLNLKLLADKNLLRINLQNGGKLFINESDANAIVNQLELVYNYRLKHLSPESGIVFKDTTTVNTIQDYTTFMPYTAAIISIDKFLFRVMGGLEKFVFDYSSKYSYLAPVAGILISTRLDESVILQLNYAYKYSIYDSYAYKKVGNLDSDSLLLTVTTNKRRDNNHNISVRFNYESDILISLAYNPEINLSNSAGESVIRQRFQLTLATQIIYEIYFNLLLSVMISSFKDGILVSDEILLLNDNENRNYIILKLSKEIFKKTFLELRYSYYYSEFSNYTTRFDRHVISSGVCLKF